MSKLDSLQSLPAACAAAASALSTVLCVAADVAMQLLGVPLPVVLAALTGALGVRVYLPPAPFWRAVAAAVGWTVAGCVCSQLALWITTQWLEWSTAPGVLAGIALVTAAFGQRVAPILWVKGGAALERRLDGLFKGGDRG